MMGGAGHVCLEICLKTFNNSKQPRCQPLGPEPGSVTDNTELTGHVAPVKLVYHFFLLMRKGLN